jgi:hypothetical protein
MYREREFWLLLAFVFVMGVVFMPREMYPGDPVTVREETRAILLHGELAVEPFVAKHYAETQERGQYVVENPNNGRSYSKYGSMLALVYVLPMAAEWFVEGDLPVFGSPRRTLYLNAFNILMSLGIAASLYRIARRFEAAPWMAATFVAICFYTTFLWNHLRVQTSDIFQLLCFTWATSAFLDVLDARPGETKPLAFGRMWAACTAMQLTKVAYVFVGPLFALALLADRLRRSDDPPLVAVWKEARLHVVPAVLAATLLAVLNWVKFGAPWTTGYHVWRPEVTALFGGDLDRNLFELAFSARWGLPYLFPVLLLAMPWMISWVRKHPVAYGGILAIALVYTILVGSLISWRGEMSYGPRYWIFSVPLVALPAVDTLRWLARRQAASIVAAFVVICILTHSVLNQMAVNRHAFFAYYYLLSPLENNLPTEAAEFFLDSSYGDVIRDFESRFPDIPWWQNMQPKIRPDAAGAYENHVRQVLGPSNLYWFK